jgi:hypothetical protein
MSDELKKEPQTPEVEDTELSGKDLEEVEGGAEVISFQFKNVGWTYKEQSPDGGTDATKK